MGRSDRNRSEIVNAVVPTRGDCAPVIAVATEAAGLGNWTDEDLEHVVAPTTERGGDE